MLTGTSHPHVPPRPKSRTVPAVPAYSGLFQPQFSPVQPSFKPLPTVSAASSSPVQPSFKPLPTVSAASRVQLPPTGMDI
uniref:Uncharacterized protein n=1 Tax=Fagus sylvatica TaxID=28930 RepID=A0A2N9IMD3_FAGSY